MTSAIELLTGFFEPMLADFKRHYLSHPVLAYYDIRSWSRGGRRLRYLTTEQWQMLLDVMKQKPETGRLDMWPNKIIGYLYRVLPHEAFDKIKLLVCPTVRGQVPSCHTWDFDTGCVYCHMDVTEPEDLEAQVSIALADRWERQIAGVKERQRLREIKTIVAVNASIEPDHFAF